MKKIISGIEYTITYVDKIGDVDVNGCQSLLGQADCNNTSIRVYRGNRSYSGIMQSIWHEILHVICENEHVSFSSEDDLDRVARALNEIAELR